MIPVFVLGAVYWVILLLGPILTRILFEQGAFDLLNVVVQSSGSHVLDFYLGRSIEALWGPLAQTVAGIALIILMLGPLKEVSPRRFFFSILAFLVFTKANVLAFPPYGDAIGGPFAEALWLAEHGFDYVGLYNQPGYAFGGPKVYFFTIFPTYLAILMKVIPSGFLFLGVNHLVFFAMAAGVVTMVREDGRKVFSPEVAGLLAALILSWPVFQTQTEAINMELPTLFFAVLSAHALIKGRIGLAGVGALLSLAVKGAGIFACAAFLIGGAVICWRDKDRNKLRAWIIWAIGLLIAALLAVAGKYLLKDQHAAAGMLRLFAGWPSLKTFPVTFFYLAQLLVMAGMGVFVYLRRESRLRRADWSPVLVYTAFAGMWFLLFPNFLAVSPRYRVALYPFLLFGLCWVLAQFATKKVFQVVGLAIAVLVIQFNSYGVRGAVMEKSDHVLLEENLQYRNDLIMYQHLAKTFKDKYSGWTVVAPFIVAQAMGIPQLGYVDQRSDVRIYGFACTYMPPFPGLSQLDLRRTIYTTVFIDIPDGPHPYPIHPMDQVVEMVEWGNKKAWLFMGGVSLEMTKRFTDQIRAQRQALGLGEM